MENRVDRQPGPSASRGVPPVRLTERQRAFLAARLETETVADAAARAGISRRSAYYEIELLQDLSGARTVREVIYMAGRERWLDQQER